jgi:hypothetical protein
MLHQVVTEDTNALDVLMNTNLVSALLTLQEMTVPLTVQVEKK